MPRANTGSHEPIGCTMAKNSELLRNPSLSLDLTRLPPERPLRNPGLVILLVLPLAPRGSLQASAPDPRRLRSLGQGKKIRASAGQN